MANLSKIKLARFSTKRPVSVGAEKWLGKPIKCLDHGFVYLVDYLGNDEAIEQAARVSYGRSSRKVSLTEGLLRYLKRHDHTSPYEMVEVKFHAKMPIFVARQWIRHRTASVNEISGRYSILDEEFYLPQACNLAEQSKNNKQGRDKVISTSCAQQIRQLLKEDAQRAYAHYQKLLNDDGTGQCQDPQNPMLARELARMGLSLNFYTQWYWKIDLHNLMHFLKLRMDKHAQYEIRVYADAIAQIIKEAFPLAWRAFADYELNAQKFSSFELEILRKLLSRKASITEEELRVLVITTGVDNKFEQGEIIEKFKKLNLL